MQLLRGNCPVTTIHHPSQVDEENQRLQVLIDSRRAEIKRLEQGAMLERG